MVTCFIFAKFLTEEGCLSVSLDETNNIQAPLAQRSFAEIKQFQVNAKTLVLANIEHFSFHQVELPFLPAKKVRAALPFALEDNLAENIEELHFAFDNHYYQNGRYLVTVSKKSYLKNLITILNQQQIHFDLITLELFALSDKETCIMESGLLVYDNAWFCGALPLDLTPFYLSKYPGDHTVYAFNGDPSLLTERRQEISENIFIWIAKRLLKNRSFSLNQGIFQNQHATSQIKRWYLATASIGVIWFIVFVVLHALKIHELNTQVKEIDSKIARIYHRFFPQSSQVISPQFRITQLLKSQHHSNDPNFWILLNKLTEAAQKNEATVEQLRWQNQVLQITLVNKNFEALENVQKFLQKNHIQVKQSQASSREEQVISNLELRL